MTVNKERLYWYTNPEWYRWNDDGIELTDKATERAKKSFELYMKPDKKKK